MLEGDLICAQYEHETFALFLQACAYSIYLPIRVESVARDATVWRVQFNIETSSSQVHPIGGIVPQRP